jgi:translation initiation factor 2 subunit 3
MMVDKKSKGLQPEINIGLVGHVDHGKTTLTERLSGKWTDTHSEEIKRGITIRLGYADTVFVKTKDGEFTTEERAAREKKEYEVLRKVSFVDAPGHESLMATMLAGATIMDGALLLISAAEQCPQPQTKEHLMALEIIGIKNIVVVQNKIDLVPEDKAIENYNQIKQFLADSPFKDAPIIPLSAQFNINLHYLIEAILETITVPKRDPNAEPLMFVARSFDINKPGSDISKMSGGVLGGSLKSGKFHVGDMIEIRPGREIEEKNQKKWIPLKTKIMGLATGGDNTKEVGPGGSIGVLTALDPSIVKSDKLGGSLVGHVGKLPDILTNLSLKVTLLKRVVGSREDLDVEPIKMKEILMLNVNSAATVGVVTKLGKNTIECILKAPVCAAPGARVTISRRIGNRFRLIGFGIIN